MKKDLKEPALPRIRCTEEFRQAVEEAAAKENRTVSGWIMNLIIKELEGKSMKELVCTVRADDKESGELVNIYWDGQNLVDGTGEEIADGQGVSTKQEAVEKAFALWGSWGTFECMMEYEG